MSHSELVQYQKKLCAQSEPLPFSLLPFPLGPLGIPDMKFLDIPKDFSIDHLIGKEVKITDSRGEVQVNLCQKLLFLHQQTHNMTTHDCSLNYKFNT